MPCATLDFETYSEAGFIWNEATNKWDAPAGANRKGLQTVGTLAYSEHPSTEVLTLSYWLPDGLGVRRWRPGQPLPAALFHSRPLESHNAMFERAIWMNVCVPKYGWPPLAPWDQRCSMATARTQCLPGALEELGDVLRLDVRKDAEGKRLLRKFSIPRDPTKNDPRRRIMPEDEPEEFERLCAYCDRDVMSEMAAAEAMIPMDPAELEFWLVDQEINWRGIGIDRSGVRDCAAILGQCLDQYSAECRTITGGLGPSQVQALVGWIQGRTAQYDSGLGDVVPY